LFRVVFIGTLALAALVALFPCLSTERGRTEHVKEGKCEEGPEEKCPESFMGTNPSSVSNVASSNYRHDLNLLEEREV
jgi:hypothetical protein